MKLVLAMFSLLVASGPLSAAKPAPLVSIPSHDAFFNRIKNLCGKSFEGKLVADLPKSDGFEGRLVMHVRKCTDSEIQIPFHVGENRSRTWIIKKTGSGLNLKHDHRKENGDNEGSTMYGGHTADAGYESAQSFPADQYSKELFVREGIPQATGNIWRMFIYPKTFSYTLIREGREFRAEFDLTKPVKSPPAPWGY